MTRETIALVASSPDPARPNAAGMKKRSGGPPRSGLASGFPPIRFTAAAAAISDGCVLTLVV